MARTDVRMGWIPDLPDRRDLLYSAPLQLLSKLPPKADLRDSGFMPDPYDQGQVGSCTANAIAGLVQFDRKKAGEAPDFVPSRLFIYYDEREMEKSTQSDAGAQIRDGIKSIVKEGVCPEDLWPYDGGLPSDQGGPNTVVFQKPSPECYAEAVKYEALSYQRIMQNTSQMRACLAQGFPFVFGVTVYKSFMDAPNGDIPFPKDGEDQLGGHAILAVGYDDDTRLITFRNSWGPTWGRGGYGTISYGYLTDTQLSSDFWTIRRISS